MRDWKDKNLPRGKPEPDQPARISRQKRKVMNQTAEYNAASDIYKSANPKCFECRRELPPHDLETDHIVRGVAGRAISLLNFDTWINQCHECHQKDQPIEDKIVLKLVNVVLAIERLRDRRLSHEQCKKICDDFVTAMRG